MSGWVQPREATIGVTCGLAGSLIRTLDPGTVLVPDLVSSTDGTVSRCDPEIRDALIRGARSIGLNPETGPLLTAAFIVTGVARGDWAARGFVAADMETAVLAKRVPRFATVRVVLDSPDRSISNRWTDPRRAALKPALWPELLWLTYAAPAYALRAARVVRAGLEILRLDNRR